MVEHNDAAWPAYKVERWPVAQLKPYARNARKHSAEQVEQLRDAIRSYGWTIPVLAREDGTIIAGHGRVEAAIAEGITEAPVIVAHGWSEEQCRAYTIADNKLALNSEWDNAVLGAELADLAELGDDLLTGFSADEIEALLEPKAKPGQTDPDDAPGAQAEAISRSGDVWICGGHRVVCGDSTRFEDVETLMGGMLADACWTDPPYNVNYESKLAGRIKNDSMADAAFRDFLRDAFRSAHAVMKPGAAIYVAHADTEGLNFRAAFKEAAFKISGCLVWAKDSLMLGRSDYQWQHEPILYGWKPGASHRWYGGRKQTTVMRLGSGAFSQNEDGSITVTIGMESIVISGADLKAQPIYPTVIRCEKPKRSAEHPTMKPVDLISRMLRNSTRQGDLVLDLFGGSGSTMIACEMLGRLARLVELDPRFVDVIVRRWQDFTGREAVLEAGGEAFATVSEARGAEREAA